MSQDTRPSIVHKGIFAGGGSLQEFYVIVEFRDGDQPAGLMVKIAKHGSDLSGFMEAWAAVTSLALESGVPWATIRAKLTGHVQPMLIESIVKAVDQAIEYRREDLDKERTITKTINAARTLPGDGDATGPANVPAPTPKHPPSLGAFADAPATEAAQTAG